jgi:hypothetical protein
MHSLCAFVHPSTRELTCARRTSGHVLGTFEKTETYFSLSSLFMFGTAEQNVAGIPCVCDRAPLPPPVHTRVRIGRTQLAPVQDSRVRHQRPCKRWLRQSAAHVTGACLSPHPLKRDSALREEARHDADFHIYGIYHTRGVGKPDKFQAERRAVMNNIQLIWSVKCSPRMASRSGSPTVTKASEPASSARSDAWRCLHWVPLPPHDPRCQNYNTGRLICETSRSSCGVRGTSLVGIVVDKVAVGHVFPCHSFHRLLHTHRVPPGLVQWAVVVPAIANSVPLHPQNKGIGLSSSKGHAVAQWLRHFATSRRVTGSITDELFFCFSLQFT